MSTEFTILYKEAIGSGSREYFLKGLNKMLKVCNENKLDFKSELDNAFDRTGQKLSAYFINAILYDGGCYLTSRSPDEIIRSIIDSKVYTFVEDRFLPDDSTAFRGMNHMLHDKLGRNPTLSESAKYTLSDRLVEKKVSAETVEAIRATEVGRDLDKTNVLEMYKELVCLDPCQPIYATQLIYNIKEYCTKNNLNFCDELDKAHETTGKTICDKHLKYLLFGLKAGPDYQLLFDILISDAYAYKVEDPDHLITNLLVYEDYDWLDPNREKYLHLTLLEYAEYLNTIHGQNIPPELIICMESNQYYPEYVAGHAQLSALYGKNSDLEAEDL